tara:strand:+ start:62 stop:403 length:342 start_codon:yes stop_codon:yes gene_type:complete
MGNKRNNKTRKLKTAYKSWGFGKYPFVPRIKYRAMRILDNLGKLEDYPKSDLKKNVKEELIRRIEYILKKKKSTKRVFKNVTRKKYNKKTKLNKLSDKKLDQLYNSILEHSRK